MIRPVPKWGSYRSVADSPLVEPISREVSRFESPDVPTYEVNTSSAETICEPKKTLIKWVPFLVEPEAEGNRRIVPSLSKSNYIISFECAPTEQSKRCYSGFDSPADIYELIRRPSMENRYHEVIRLNVLQKPRFDIDVSISELPETTSLLEFGESIKDMLIEAVVKVLAVDRIEVDLERDVMIYTSHGAEKMSYHVILNRYKHNNLHEAKAFYHLCKAAASDPVMFQQYVDDSIYSKNHCFRLQGCHKYGSSLRPKVYSQDFIYRGNHYRHVIDHGARSKGAIELSIFSNGLVTFTSGTEKMLPLYVDPSSRPKTYNSSVQLSSNSVDMAMELLYGRFGKLLYSYKGVDGNCIHLTRNRPSYCEGCSRTHDKRDPFMYVVGTSLWYRCHRVNPSWKGDLLGEITTISKEKVDEVIERAKIMLERETFGIATHVDMESLIAKCREVDINTLEFSVNVTYLADECIKEVIVEEPTVQAHPAIVITPPIVTNLPLCRKAVVRNLRRARRNERDVSTVDEPAVTQLAQEVKPSLNDIRYIKRTAKNVKST